MTEQKAREVTVDSGFTPENIADAEWLVANMPGIRRFHDMATYERAIICRTAARFRESVIAAKLAEKDAEIARLTLERDGARKAMGLFMGCPDMPSSVLQWVQFQMSRQALKQESPDRD